MKKIYLLVVVAVLSAVSAGFSEPIRPLMSKENRMPGMFEFEVGSMFSYKEFDESSTLPGSDRKRFDSTITPYFRFGLLEYLALYSKCPVGFVDSDAIGKHNGLGDISAGLELRAYEHTYTYPYVIPYMEVSFPTGDEDHGLGTGEFLGTFGTAIGTTVYDCLHYILDGRYEYLKNSKEKSEGIFSAALAIIWSISDKFSVLGEAKVAEEPSGSNKGTPAYFNGGMCFEASEVLHIYWYGGTTANTDEKGSATVKVALSF